MPKFDASKLLYNEFEKNRFINELEVEAGHIEFMRSARTKVRNKLKSAFTQAKSSDLYLSRMDEAEQTVFKNIEPRFWPQGSFAYGTQNVPAQIPPQQLDIDDGVYLPIEALRERPIVNKQIFFDIVDSALQDLAHDEGWAFVAKETCARLELDWMTHLDVPLYAIPVDRFEGLQKAVGRVAFNEQYLDADDEQNMMRKLAEQEVYLAVRSNTHWKKSDPIRIQAWFEQEQELFGERLTRVCRYFKAWRDHCWGKGGPSSIALMICVWEVFSESARPFQTDSEAIHAVCKQLPNKLKQGVLNPVAEEETVFPRDLNTNEHDSIVSVAAIFCGDVVDVLDVGSSPELVVEKFSAHWGSRLPQRPDWVELANVAAAGVVKSTPASPQVKPKIGTLRSAYRSG
ncbi:MAG: CBASS cGAMP synthase [Candidatus Reddybacter sp.]